MDHPSIHIDRVSTPELHRLLGRFLAEIDVNMADTEREGAARKALRRSQEVARELRLRGEQLSFDLRER